ncbi:hypothetical protein [Dyella mobilis]|uniref:Uncharacterized protein n=1 Tax=Dyella mobilis TaxID=1849582 RepID=A0ABS2KEK7_9GAMM|nr:hypothetical protein [Dyella mobilis]MBM7128783.1 hypothetical protein [Dyella mobilis]GLQ99115.1 hypothetical protein GCM10007863_35350 [Dyella mobilis]
MFDADAVAFLSGKNSLLDSTLRSLCISGIDGEASVEIIFRSRHGADYTTATLKFTEVSEFSFYHSNKFYFYNVEDLKFYISSDGEIYLSLDPYGGSDEISARDKDLIVAKHLQLEIA